MSRPDAYRAACAIADERRARLLATLADARARIVPARLHQDARQMVGATVSDSMASLAAKVRQRPVAIGAASAAFILFLFRRPVAALFGRLYVRWKNPDLESDDA